MPSVFKRYSLGDFGNAVFVDDASEDPSLQYFGGWQQSTQGGVWNNTISSATDTRSSIVFSFIGTAVAVLGEIAGETFADSMYTIDGSFNTSYPSFEPSRPQQNFTFFSVNSLSPGPHTLAVNITTVADYYFDYIAYQPLPDTTSPPSTDTANGSLSSAFTGSSETPMSSFAFPSASTSPLSIPDQATSTKSHSNLAIILPAALSSALVLLLVGFGWWWKRRHSRPYWKKEYFGSKSRESAIVDGPSDDFRQLHTEDRGIFAYPTGTIPSPSPSLVPFTLQQGRVVQSANVAKGSQRRLIVANPGDTSITASCHSHEDSYSSESHTSSSGLGGRVLHAEPNDLAGIDFAPTQVTSS
ncbi:hypothetical protein EIP86_001921 [Pleurotus ostreatoroseus]|nr:hypothetical protein EIP86_001921 [Pleurotus ostreatoroseus]